MAFPEKAGEIVSLEEGARWTRKYRETNPGAVKAHLFSADLLQRILKQPKCAGMRMYNALDDNNNQVLVLVGVDDNGNDIENGIIVERALACPPLCPSRSILNGD